MLDDVQNGEKRLFIMDASARPFLTRQNQLSVTSGKVPCLASLHDVAAPVATASRCTVWATFAAEPPRGGCRKRAELVAEDGGAHPNEREVTVQAAATGGATIPQHGHRMHEEVSVDVVVLQWQAGGHGTGHGQR
jgi:hypothetical protein